MGIAVLIGRLTGADRKDVARRIEAQGAKVVWVKRLDSMSEKSGPFDRYGSVTFYDVLVEREGVRRIEVWRDGPDGIFKDH